MTKAQIRAEYNSLTSTLQTELDTYKLLTGKDFPCRRTNNMSIDELSDYKENLERMLNMRKSNIYSVREAIDAFNQAENLKSTEEGRAFIKSLELKKDELAVEEQSLKAEFKDSFNRMLASVGLSDWEIPERYVVAPSLRYKHFDIVNKTNKNASLSIRIEIREAKWQMEAISSMHCERTTLQSRGAQYLQFKGYITLSDTCDKVQEWMDTDYDNMAKRMYDIHQAIDQNAKDIENPAEAYCRS